MRAHLLVLAWKFITGRWSEAGNNNFPRYVVKFTHAEDKVKSRSNFRCYSVQTCVLRAIGQPRRYTISAFLSRKHIYLYILWIATCCWGPGKFIHICAAKMPVIHT